MDAAANERKFQDGLTDAVTESIKKKREFPPEDRACQFFVNDAARRAEQQLPEEQREYATRIALAMADDDEIDHPAHDLKLLRVQVNEIARKMGFANYNAGRRAAKERHAQVLLEDQVCASFADKAARRAEKILPEEQLPYVTLIARSMFDGDSLNEAMKYTKLPQARIEHIVKTMGFTHYEAGRRAAKERLATAQASPRP